MTSGLLHYCRYQREPDGVPIGIDRVCRRWRLSGDPAPESPWLEPDGDDLKSHLIEAPFRIRSVKALTSDAEEDGDLLHGQVLGMNSRR